MHKIMIGSLVRDRAWVLPAFLDAIYALDYPRDLLTLVFILNNSTDESERILLDFYQEHLGEYDGIRVIYHDLPGDPPLNLRKGAYRKAIIRNLVLLRNHLLDQVAMEDYLLSVDCDILLPPGALKALLAEDKDIIAALVNNHPKKRWPNIYDTSSRQPWWDHPNDQPFECDVTGAAILLSRQVCRLVRYGWDDHGEDVVFCRNARSEGFAVWAHPLVRGNHVMRESDWSESLFEADVIVTNFNRLNYLQPCLESIEKHTRDVRYRLTVIDVGSTDGGREYLLKEWAHRANLLFANPSQLFSYAQDQNRCMRFCREKYVALLNNDCEACPEWLRNAIDALEADKTIGHLAHKVLYHDRAHVMSHGANLDRHGNTTIPFMRAHKDAPQVNRPGNYAYAGFGIYRRDVLERVGYLPEWPVKIYWDDTSYGMRVNALGLDVRYCPESVIVHSMPLDRGEAHTKSAQVGREYFMAEWGEFLRKNNGYAPDYPKKNTIILNGSEIAASNIPHRNGEGAYQGQPFHPLGWAVSALGVGETLR